ncbi:MAG: hypothetical protein AAGF36_02530 [Pseudomonadota bacterium]
MTAFAKKELAEERAEESLFNRLMKRFSDFLGLTTGIGVIARGAWSLVTAIALTVYERSGLTVVEIQIEDAFNQGLLQSAMLIALGAVILELRRIAGPLSGGRNDG